MKFEDVINQDVGRVVKVFTLEKKIERKVALVKARLLFSLLSVRFAKKQTKGHVCY